MGRSAGRYTLLVRVEGIEQPLRILAQARPARPANLSFDDEPTPRSASRSGTRLVAIVADVYGNPIADAPVSFRVSAGAVTPARAVTDARGRVALRWTQAQAATEQRLAGTNVDEAGCRLTKALLLSGCAAA